MLNTSIFAAFFVCCCSLFHMVHAFAKPGNSDHRMEKYYWYTHRANVEMCRWNNDRAFKLFDSAFAYVSYPFAMDLNNAVYTGVHSLKPDEGRLLKYLKLMASKGINLEEKFKDLPDHLYYVSKMEKDNFPDSSLIDSAYVKNVTDAYASDQVLREFSFTQFRRYYDSSLMPAIEKIDSMNYILMESVFRHALKEDTPLEQLLGIDANSNLEIIYIHNVGWGRYDKDLTDSLIAKGLVDARQYAFFYDKNCNSFYGQFPKDGTAWGKEFNCHDFYELYGTHLVYLYEDGTAFIPLLKAEELAVVTKNRKQLFLGDLYEEAKLKVFAQWNSVRGVESPFRSVFPADQKQIAEFEKNMLGWRPGYYKYTNTDSFDFDKNPIVK